VPREHQQRVLIFGIAASLCLRAAFIALGAALLELLWSGTGQACRRTGRSG
jgi:predicted tellurium resistance membrane protein TerC